MTIDEPKDRTETAVQDSAATVITAITAIIPAARLGHRELLRVGAGLGLALDGSNGQALADVARAEGVTSASIDLVLMRRTDRSVLASSERRVVALGTRSFLLGPGVVPQRPNLEAAASAEAVGGQVIYVVIVDRPCCLGLCALVRGMGSVDGAVG